MAGPIAGMEAAQRKEHKDPRADAEEDKRLLDDFGALHDFQLRTSDRGLRICISIRNPHFAIRNS